MQTAITGLVVAIIGFFSSFPIVLAGLQNMGASPEQAASGLMASALAMGLAGIVIASVTRLPASVAWSTPGVAFLIAATTPANGFSSAVAAFIVAGFLTVVAGLWRPLAQAASRIPVPIAQAMLAGVLLKICTGPFLAVSLEPWTAIPLMLTWFFARLFSRVFAVPVTVLAAAALILWQNGGAIQISGPLITPALFTWPTPVVADILSIGIPLFLITMATQNIPGIAVLKSYGYTPNSGPMFATVGAFSVLAAPFGTASVCLAAFTASLCANDDSHPDPSQRYKSAIWAGLFYCIMGLFAGVITQFAGAASPQLLPVLAGIALFSVFIQSTCVAFSEESSREAAGATFLVTASGVAWLGLGSAIWGLLIGLAIYMLNRIR